MKTLKDWKPILISLVLSSLIVGGLIHSLTATGELGLTKSFQKKKITRQTEQSSTVDLLSDKLSVVNTQSIREQPEHQTHFQTEKAKSNVAPTKNNALPGLFRGDWGSSPVYAKNDRVNYERCAYLSLIDDNHNQPPTTSLGYWRLVKKFKAISEANCFDPAPGSDMGECDFSTKVDGLKDRDLRLAKLMKARLNGKLGSADLTGANLSGAAVLGKLVIGQETVMTNANLSYLQSDGNNPLVGENANLVGVNFTKANLYGAKLSHADLSQGKFPEAVLTGADLTSVNLSDARLQKADLTYTNLTGSNLSSAELTATNFEQADLHQANFSGAKLQQANLAGVQLAEANLSGADLRGAILTSAQGADTSVIDNQTNFTGAVCPDGITVDGTQVLTCVGHGF